MSGIVGWGQQQGVGLAGGVAGGARAGEGYVVLGCTGRARYSAPPWLVAAALLLELLDSPGHTQRLDRPGGVPDDGRSC